MTYSDLRQSTQYVRYLHSIGWSSEKLIINKNIIYAYIRRLPLLSKSAIKIQRPISIPSNEQLNYLAQKHKALFIQLEPNNSTKTNNQTQNQIPNFLPSSPYLPSKTIHINLSLPKEKLWQNLKKDCRHSITKALNQQIVIKTVNIQNKTSLKNFYQAWKKTRRGHIPSFNQLNSLLTNFQNNSLILTCLSIQKTNQHARIKNQNIAGAIFLISNQKAYYYYAFTNSTGRQTFAQYLLIWQAMLKLQKKGIKILDLEGIYDPRFKFTRKWLGFSHFKKSFGGKIITYPTPLIRFYPQPIGLIHQLHHTLVAKFSNPTPKQSIV